MNLQLSEIPAEWADKIAAESALHDLQEEYSLEIELLNHILEDKKESLVLDLDDLTSESEKIALIKADLIETQKWLKAPIIKRLTPAFSLTLEEYVEKFKNNRFGLLKTFMRYEKYLPKVIFAPISKLIKLVFTSTYEGKEFPDFREGVEKKVLKKELKKFKGQPEVKTIYKDLLKIRNRKGFQDWYAFLFLKVKLQVDYANFLESKLNVFESEEIKVEKDRTKPSQKDVGEIRLINIDKNITQELYEILKKYFQDSSHVALQNVLEGKAHGEKLCFKGNRNKFIYVFYELKEAKLIQDSKVNIEDWICSNFDAFDERTKQIVAIKKYYAHKIMVGQAKPKKESKIDLPFLEKIKNDKKTIVQS